MLAIGISGHFLYNGFLGYYTYPSEGIAGTTGRSLAYTFMIFFIANSLRKKWAREKLEFWLLCFAVSFSLCATYDLVKTNKKSKQLNNSKQELARLARDFSDTVSPKESINEYSTEEYGDFSNLLPLMKHSLDFSERMASEINAACADLENVLAPANLCEYENIIQSKVLIAIFVDKLDYYRKKYDEEFFFIQTKIKEAFPRNEALKRQVLNGFEEGKRTSDKLMNDYFRVERESAQKIDAILNFLSTKSGTFWESEGILFFKKDKDATTYNQLFQNLIEHTQKEELVIKKLESHRRSVLQEMENF